jgi:GT2 family glycosyltransferase
MMVSVSVIILNLNSSRVTIDCVESIIFFTKGLSYEIILVDNGSSDSSAVILQKKFKKTPQVKLIHSSRNLGFGGGNNLGAKSAQGKYLLFLNNDTLFIENSLKKLLKEFENLSKKEKIAFIQPRLYLDKTLKKVQQTSSQIPATFQILQENFIFLQGIKKDDFSKFRYLGWDRNSQKKVDCVCGAAMFCRKDFFEKVGKFDERFQIYFEEYDLGIRSKILGHKSYFTPETSIIHFHQKWPAPYWYKKFVYVKSCIKYFLKDYSEIKQ